jgi:murein L,D-transpeptidase YcbB/YkuD
MTTQHTRTHAPTRFRGKLIGYTALIACLSAAPVQGQDVDSVGTPPSLAPAVQTSGPRPVVLPELAAAQANQLVRLLNDDGVAQGLTDAPSAMPVDNNALVRAALDHARAVHAGRLAEADFQRDWAMRPMPYDPLPSFSEAVKQDRLAAWIASLPPPYAGYDTLVAGLRRYRGIADAGGWASIAAGANFAFGKAGPHVAALRKRLAVEDPVLTSDSNRFDATLVEAVRRAQRRYGLNPTGAVRAQTIAALNMPVGARLAQIKANMERWRWLPPQLATRRVQVNVAAAVLTLFDGDAPVMSMKAVTGRPGDETPMLVSRIHSIVLNPPWNVPASIATRELWPKEKANPGYLARNGFRVVETGDGGKRLQQSSERSALGKFKFDFDNPFAVYLHDTPAQSGFSQFSRLASHGCVRLEKPAELAAQLLDTTPDWPADAIDATVATGKTVRAKLAAPVAVYLLYWTAFANPTGQMSFRDDPYGWDRILADKIAARSVEQMLAAH